MPREIMMVTGEASGDLYGALLAEELRRLRPDLRLVGVGGQAMASAGVDILLDSGGLSVVGIWEAIVRLGRLRRAMNRVSHEIRTRKPDLVVLIDYPGMNLRLARVAKRCGVKVMYYVSPQVWAWGGGRVKTVRQTVDKMVVILPFEEAIYRGAGVDATYVGHPLMDVVRTELDRGSFFRQIDLPADRRLVALLPGSRRQELKQHLGPLADAADILSRRFDGLGFVLVTLPGLEGAVREELGKRRTRIPVVCESRYEAIAYSDVAITCSGTVTLEAALLGTPMIVVYRLALFSWILGRMMVRVPYISLVNLVARRRVVPELIQSEVNAQRLAEEAGRILADDRTRRDLLEGLAQVRARLGSGGATRRAAEIAASLAG
ncbi:MAG: lipid-A-disaccharide synthase [bacterium]